MIQIKTFIFNPFQENTYLLYDETKEAVVIDPGCYNNQEEDELVSFINDNELKLVRLLNTHCHIDHVLGNRFVKEKFNLQLEANKEDEILAKNAKSHGATFGIQMQEEAPDIDVYLNEGDQIKFGNSTLEIVHVPGHSPGSIVFYNKNEQFMIVGDVLFNDSIGRTDLPGGNYDLLASGIKGKLFPLGDDMKVFPGHGTYTTIGKERRTNPFL